MQGRIIVSIISLVMAMPATACAGGGRLMTTTAADTSATAGAVGSGLQERVEAAIQKERAASKDARFWTVYKFKLRKGIGLDAELRRSANSKTYIRGLRIKRRAAVETRNAAVYLLHDLSDNSVEKVEVHDLDRHRDESGLPVRMLGDAETGESLDLLKRLLDKRPGGLVGERLVLSIALHDDPQVESILKNIIGGTYEEKERSQAALWLGELPGQSEYLAGVARDERMPSEVRKQAVIGIGYSNSPGALSVLRNLYKTAPSREVKEQCLFAASVGEDKKGAAAFLNEVKANDPDPDFRRQAAHWLERLAGQDI
jgi:hypothetical protein